MTQRVSQHKGHDNLFARSLLCAAGAAEVAKAFDVPGAAGGSQGPLCTLLMLQE